MGERSREGQWKRGGVRPGLTLKALFFQLNLEGCNRGTADCTGQQWFGYRFIYHR